MKVIAIAAVTAGGKTTTVNEIKKQLSNVQTLHFDDYVFEGEVDNFYQWVLDGADYNIWNVEPLVKDILRVKNSGICDYLILDYPFAYYNEQIRKYIDVAPYQGSLYPVGRYNTRETLRESPPAINLVFSRVSGDFNNKI